MRWCPATEGLSRVGTAVLTALVLLVGGCATAPDPSNTVALAEYNQLNDPGEPTNRAIFAINRGLDGAILKPIATVYRDATPQFFQDRVNDVLENLHAPVVFANDVLQGQFDRAVTTVARFMINSTIGLLGLFDMATEIGIEGHDEDFGQTLAVWGMEEGPYIMLPIFGPSNPRDTIGLIVDFLIDPLHIWANNTDRDYVILARGGTRAVDTRAIYMDAMDDLEKSSLDFYAAIRSLYRQRRAEEIRNGKLPADMPAPGIGQAPSGPRLSGREQALRIH